MRKMLRWALKTAPIDTRVSMLYLASIVSIYNYYVKKAVFAFTTAYRITPVFVPNLYLVCLNVLILIY
jgi:hypothetical protein